MGIPSYFVSLLRSNSKLLQKLTSKFDVNALYFDANSIIYDVIYQLENDEKQDTIRNDIIYKKICDKLTFYIKLVQPKNEVFISFDGVAPAAKLEQQRQRRYKSQIIRGVKSALQPTVDVGFNTSQITPGTAFMTNLCSYINKYFNKHFNKHYNKCKLNIILDLSDKPGEGEHKVFNYIRNNHSNLINKYNVDTYNHVVYGLDSDLIMLSLINYDVVNNIYLLREAPHFIQKINKNYKPGTLYYIDFNKSKDVITHGIHQDDYIVISFILGNDFISHNPAFNLRNNGLDVLLNVYKTTFKDIGERNLTCLNEKSKKSIHMENLRHFFIKLSIIEKKEFIKNIEHKFSYCNKVQQPYSKTHTHTIEDKLNLIPKLNFNIERNILQFEFTKDSWKKNYYKTCFDTCFNNKKDINVILSNYLEALQWNFDYYAQNDIDVYWKYNYHFSPLVSDLVFYMDDYSCFSRQFNKGLTNSTKNKIHPQTQLAYVLPKESYIFIDKTVDKYINNYHPEVIHHELGYKYAFSSYLWEGHLNLNIINIETLDNDIKNHLNITV